MFSQFQKHKFRAKPTTIDEIRFGSKKEAKYYQCLKVRQQQGEIIFFLRQVPIHLPGKPPIRYVVDFVEFHRDGTVHFIDVKGMSTPMYKLKKNQVESIYPIQIEEV